MAYLVTCSECGAQYCRNAGPQDTHVCKTLEQRRYEREEAVKRAMDAAEQADLPSKVRRLEAALDAYRWIPVGEGLPKKDGLYSTLSQAAPKYPCSKKYKDGRWDSLDAITHWREIDLPETE